MLDFVKRGKRIRNAYKNMMEDAVIRVAVKDMMQATMMFQPIPPDMPEQELRQIVGAQNLIKRAFRMAHMTDEQIENMAKESVDE